MRSEQFNYSSKKSNIRGKKEQVRRTEKRNWDRIIYLAILSLLVIGLIYYLTSNYFTVRGEGRLLSDQVVVRAPLDISMDDFYTRVGEKVEPGDSLFLYHSFESNIQSDTAVQYREKINERANDLAEAREEAAQKRQELEALNDKLAYYQNEKERVEKEIKLDVATVQRLQDIKENILDLRWDIKSAEQKLGYLYHRRNRIQSQKSERSMARYTSSGEAGAGGLTVGQRVFRSPVQGTVTNIYKDPSEFSFKEEEIIAINKDSARVLVKAVFDREDAPNLEKGTELNIRFYNGEPSMGQVVDAYAARANLESITNGTGIESDERIVVEIEPVNATVRSQWQQLDGMGLTAYKSLF